MTGNPPTIPPLTAPEFLATTAADFPTLEVTDRVRMVGENGCELRWVKRKSGLKLEGSRRGVQMAEFAVLLEMSVRIHPDNPEPTVASFDSDLGVVAAMQWALGDRAHLTEVTPQLWNMLHAGDDDPFHQVVDLEDEDSLSGVDSDQPGGGHSVGELPFESLDVSDED